MQTKFSFKIIDYKKLISSYEDDIDLIPDLVSTFFEHTKESLPSIKKAIDDKSPEDLIKTSHALKSMVSNFYAIPMQDILLRLENKGNVANFNGVIDLYNELEINYSKFKIELVQLKNICSI